MRAKAAVSDEESVFVTWVNLTESALGRDIEHGLRVCGRVLAWPVANRIQALIDHQILHESPLASDI